MIANVDTNIYINARENLFYLCETLAYIII